VVEVVENDRAATYKLTTTVMLNMNMNNVQVGDALLAGSLTRQVPANYPPLNFFNIFSIRIYLFFYPIFTLKRVKIRSLANVALTVENYSYFIEYESFFHFVFQTI